MNFFNDILIFRYVIEAFFKLEHAALKHKSYSVDAPRWSGFSCLLMDISVNCTCHHVTKTNLMFPVAYVECKTLKWALLILKLITGDVLWPRLCHASISDIHWIPLVTYISAWHSLALNIVLFCSVVGLWFMTAARCCSTRETWRVILPAAQHTAFPSQIHSTSPLSSIILRCLQHLVICLQLVSLLHLLTLTCILV